MMLLRLRGNQRGFFMPVLVILISLMALTGFSVLLQANNGLNFSYKQSYIQMARVASKAAIDYSQEQFDSALCGNYSGTSEQNLVSNSHYRITFSSQVISTSADGFSKTIQATGNVYLPQNAAHARYVYSVDAEIVRTYAVCKTPGDFGPTVWLDASDQSTLFSQTSGTVHRATSFGNWFDGTRDTLQELASSGNQSLLAWQDSSMQMSTCSILNFDSLTCLFLNSKYLNNGMVFQNVNVPKGATITSATLSLPGATPSGTGGSETNQVTGIYQSTSNPYTPLFTQSGTNQLKTPLTTSGMHTNATVNFTTNNLPPGNKVTVNVASIVQEMVNNPNWGTAIADGKNDQNNLGLAIKYVSGTGNRNLSKNGITLDVTYSVNGVTQATNGGSVTQWNDKSGNGNHAIFGLGTAPTRVDNQINGNTVVRFNNGALLSTLNDAITNNQELTVLGVVKPNFSTSGSDGRFMSGTSSTANNDTTSGSSIVPLLRYGSTAGFSSIYSGTSYRTNYTCGATCTNTSYIFGSVFQINSSSSNKVDGLLRGNGAQVAQSVGLNPVGSPYTFGINQLYFGGTRSGAMPGTGVNYMNGDYAELIVYDHALTCHQIESLEDYLRGKWGIAASAYPDTCPADTIPVL
ncbi:MAG TPA: hypothetical protein VJR27_05790 [Candidatus Saccharimonadales bacterium]|nr:hypothetical protein [Candidatus Saccharimonadales bacterium]